VVYFSITIDYSGVFVWAKKNAGKKRAGI